MNTVARLFDTRQLEIFVALAKAGSYTEAARQLSLTQSAISHSLKALENDLDSTLVERVGRRIQLTPAGEFLFKEASRLIDDLSRTRQEVEAINAWGHGRLRISAGVTACEFILPSILREFKECFPEAPIQIAPADSAEALSLLHSHHVDLALIVDAPEDSQLCKQDLFQDDLQFVVGSAHPWVRAGKVNLQDISSQSFILYNRQSHTFQSIERYFRQRHWRLQSFIEMGSMNAIKELIKIGLGVGLLPAWLVDKEIREGSLHSFPLNRPRLRRQWSICWQQSKKLTLAEETFLGLCTAAVDNLALQGKIRRG